MQLVASWTRDDRANLAQFFSSPTGAKYLEILRINKPKVVGKTIDERAMTGTASQTWEDCINASAVIIGTDPEDRSSVEKLEQFDVNAFSSAPGK
jgi:hypothetical protein